MEGKYYPRARNVYDEERGEIPKSETEGSDIRNSQESRLIAMYKILGGCLKFPAQKAS